jgi:hypothetical protein
LLDELADNVPTVPLGHHPKFTELIVHLWPGTSTMKRPRIGHMLTGFAMTVGTLGGGFLLVTPCAAQVITVPGGQQNQPPQNPLAGQPQPSLPAPGVPANVITSQTTPGLKSNIASPNPGSSLGLAGRGLPGMPGGPPLNAPMGAQDPSPRFMRPPVVGPLFCDPAINITC